MCVCADVLCTCMKMWEVWGVCGVCGVRGGCGGGGVTQENENIVV